MTTLNDILNAGGLIPVALAIYHICTRGRDWDDCFDLWGWPPTWRWY